MWYGADPAGREVTAAEVEGPMVDVVDAVGMGRFSGVVFGVLVVEPGFEVEPVPGVPVGIG